MSAVPDGLNPAADISVHEDGALVLVVEGHVATFRVSSDRLRAFARELNEVALAMDLRAQAGDEG